MLHSREEELASRLLREDPRERWSHADAVMRNPARNYADPARLEAELQSLFLGRPVFAGLSVDCPDTGSYITREVAGVPIAIVRQKSGELKAFVNICPHRGARLFEGDGQKRRFVVCPYHAWTFGIDGTLANTPEADRGFEDIQSDCRLTERAVAEKHGLIFVHATSEEPFEIDPLLHGMESEFDNYGIPTAYPIETRVTTWQMNWKMLIDTFMEAYHVRFLHQATVFPKFASYQLFDRFGELPRVIGLREAVFDQLKNGPAEGLRLFPNAAAVYVLVPNGLLAYQGDHLEAWRVEPIDVNSCKVYLTLYAPSKPETEKAMNYWMKNLEKLCEVSFSEDFPMQEQIQRNLASGAMDELVYGRNEPGMIGFHSFINRIVDAWEKGQGMSVPAQCGGISEPGRAVRDFVTQDS
jgi:phenylpropionate dioxygenase-like ring-hydroxylating dioxygenase large terminal subunit